MPLACRYGQPSKLDGGGRRVRSLRSCRQGTSQPRYAFGCGCSLAQDGKGRARPRRGHKPRPDALAQSPAIVSDLGSSANEGQVGQAGPRRYRQGRPCAAPPVLGRELEPARSSSCWRRKCSLNRAWRLPGQIPEIRTSSCRFLSEGYGGSESATPGVSAVVRTIPMMRMKHVQPRAMLIVLHGKFDITDPEPATGLKGPRHAGLHGCAIDRRAVGRSHVLDVQDVVGEEQPRMPS
jgi:hypothetical protein